MMGSVTFGLILASLTGSLSKSSFLQGRSKLFVLWIRFPQPLKDHTDLYYLSCSFFLSFLLQRPMESKARPFLSRELHYFHLELIKIWWIFRGAPHPTTKLCLAYSREGDAFNKNSCKYLRLLSFELLAAFKTLTTRAENLVGLRLWNQAYAWFSANFICFLRLERKDLQKW